MDYRHSTVLLLLGVILGGIFGWGLVFVTGYTGIVIGWAGLLAGVAGLGVRFLPNQVTQNKAWKVWLGVSVIGLAVNTVAQMASGPIAVRYGGFHPWFILLGIGYLFTGLHNRSDARLSDGGRILLVSSGIASFVALLWVLVESKGILELTIILAGISVLPPTILGVWFLIRVLE